MPPAPTATLDADVLTLDTGRISRAFRWNRGHVISASIARVGLAPIILTNDRPDLSIPGHDQPAADGSLDVQYVPADRLTPGHVRAVVTCTLGTLEVRREFRLYPDCPAIACDFWLRGRSDQTTWMTRPDAQAAMANVEKLATLRAIEPGPVVERLFLPRRHLRLRSVRFYDVTDRRYDLVEPRDLLSSPRPVNLTGNLLLASDVLDPSLGIFVLREAPCSDIQLHYPGADFQVTMGKVSVTGLGVEPGDLLDEPGEWVKAYGVVVGVASGDEASLLTALRTYQHARHRREPARDDMILLNTWGDRGQDKKVGHDFALAEIDAAARLGMTRFQMDDGWQHGRSSNSALGSGSMLDLWRRDDYWTPDPHKFPRGLTPIVEYGKKHGVELGLWYAPSMDEHARHWRRDADRLLSLWKELGVRTFKIDMTDIDAKLTDTRLRRLFEAVMRESGGEITLNLDVTAKRRYGYHYFTGFGNFFLENRYTDWGNYYPHLTLQALWSLARYVPPQSLQVEFLNVTRNAQKYPADDPLAPARVPFEFAFAVTMAAQPLAWFEATGLPGSLLDAAMLIRGYRALQGDLHNGIILPIGEAPDGTNACGFQSMLEGRGHVIAYRMCNDRPGSAMKLWNPGVKVTEVRRVLGEGEMKVDGEGTAHVTIDRPWGFGVFEYR